MCTEHGLHLLQDCRPAGGPSLSRRAALVATATAASAVLVGVATPAQAAASAPARRWSRHGLMDLTYPLGPEFPAFAPGEEARRRTVVQIEPDGYYMQEWTLIEHTGTHVDAPGHFAKGGRLADRIAVAELITPAVVIDIAAKAARNPDALVTVDDVRAFERRHGTIPTNAAVLMYSGWGAKVGSVDAYRGTDAAGMLHFPGFDPEAATWLLRHRRIRSLGVDTLSIDRGESETFDTHLIVNGADRYGIENLANLHCIPPTGATITVGLIPFRQGSGGQARVFASW